MIFDAGTMFSVVIHSPFRSKVPCLGKCPFLRGNSLNKGTKGGQRNQRGNASTAVAWGKAASLQAFLMQCDAALLAEGFSVASNGWQGLWGFEHM